MIIALSGCLSTDAPKAGIRNRSDDTEHKTKSGVRMAPVRDVAMRREVQVFERVVEDFEPSEARMTARLDSVKLH